MNETVVGGQWLTLVVIVVVGLYLTVMFVAASKSRAEEHSCMHVLVS